MAGLVIFYRNQMRLFSRAPNIHSLANSPRCCHCFDFYWPKGLQNLFCLQWQLLHTTLSYTTQKAVYYYAMTWKTSRGQIVIEYYILVFPNIKFSVNIAVTLINSFLSKLVRLWIAARPMKENFVGVREEYQRNQSCPDICCHSQVRIHKWRVIPFPEETIHLLASCFYSNLIMLSKYFQLHLMFHSPSQYLFIFPSPCSSETEFVIEKYSALLPFLWPRPKTSHQVGGKWQRSTVLTDWARLLIFITYLYSLYHWILWLVSKSVWGQVVSRQKIYFVIHINTY